MTEMAADQGTTVKVTVPPSPTTPITPRRLTSAPTATLAGTPNTAQTGAPTITGTAEVGETLTASTTVQWMSMPTGLTSPTYGVPAGYGWTARRPTIALRRIPSTYILVDADLGKTLKVRVTFDDPNRQPTTEPALGPDDGDGDECRRSRDGRR